MLKSIFGKWIYTGRDGMIIQHNIASMNANRMLGMTTVKQKKNSEKLSSGYKINRAADDAAGLSISEKMRRQIRGLNRGSVNSNDGISLAQTAEGALAEVHDMLHRMNELAVQAANGTNSRSDRNAIQDEIEQIEMEIDRVSESTKFNETYLLKGGSGMRTQYINIHDAGLDGIISNSTAGVSHGSFTMQRLNASDVVMIAARNYTIGTGKADVQSIINTTGVGGDKVVINNQDFYIIEQNGSAPCQQTSYISNRVGTGTSDVKIGSNHYVLRSGGAIAERAGTVARAVTASTRSVSIAALGGGTTNYELWDGSYKAEYASTVAAAISSGGSNIRSVTINGSTYNYSTASGYVATDWNTLSNSIDNAYSVRYGGNTYTLKRNVGGAIYSAETAGNISGNLSGLYIGSTVSVYDASSNTNTTYTVAADDSDMAINRIQLSTLQGIVSSLSATSRVVAAGARYEVQSYNSTSVKNGITNDVEVNVDGTKYLAKTAGNYKSLSDLNAQVSGLSTDSKVSVNNNGTTTDYKIKNYNYSSVRAAVSSVAESSYDNPYSTVTVDGASYMIKNYNMASVKNAIASFDYSPGVTTGIIMEVDGAQYTAETYHYRQAICMAYGEDQQTNVTAPGAGTDDLLQDGDTVTFHDKTYTLMVDSNSDGYDDVDSFLVTEGRAYKIIAKEIEKASSIGATDSQAIVRDKNNVDIVDSVTMAADFLEDPNSERSLVRFEIDRGSVLIEKELHVNIHAGTDADMENKIGIDIKSMSSSSLGIENINVVDDSGINATYALDAIEDAIKEVSKQRSLLGAIQNRMEHTIRNLDNVVENTTKSESTLRDTDMAEEMVAYSKNNILAQAGQAMLTQASKTPQAVMSLLQ